MKTLLTLKICYSGGRAGFDVTTIATAAAGLNRRNTSGARSSSWDPGGTASCWWSWGPGSKPACSRHPCGKYFRTSSQSHQRSSSWPQYQPHHHQQAGDAYSGENPIGVGRLNHQAWLLSLAVTFLVASRVSNQGYDWDLACCSRDSQSTRATKLRHAPSGKSLGVRRRHQARLSGLASGSGPGGCRQRLAVRRLDR